MKEVLKALRPVRARLRRNRFLRGLAFGLAAGLGLAAAMELVHTTEEYTEITELVRSAELTLKLMTMEGES